MHYIRTKDLVFAASYQENGYIYTIDCEIGCEPHEVVAESDNLNELCDAFVSLFSDGDFITETDYEKALNRFKGLEGIRKPKKLYGALLTDKGLIYVAAADKLGRLRLL